MAAIRQAPNPSFDTEPIAILRVVDSDPRPTSFSGAACTRQVEIRWVLDDYD